MSTGVLRAVHSISMRSISACTIGWMMDSNLWRNAGSLKACCRTRGRFIPPSDAINFAPQIRVSSGMANPPGAVDCREIASASRIAPWQRRSRHFATVDLPLPIPPVMPNRITWMCASETNQAPGCVGAHQQGEQASARKKRAEWDVTTLTQLAVDLERNTDQDPYDRRH